MQRRSVLALGAGLAMGAVRPLRADEATSGKLSVWLGYGETAPTYRFAEAAFKKTYPNVQLELLTFDLREFEAKLAVAVPTGNGPDILALHDFCFRATTRTNRSTRCRPISRPPSATRRSSTRPSPRSSCATASRGACRGGPAGTRFSTISTTSRKPARRPPKTLKEMWDFSEKLVKRGPDGTLTRAGISLRLTEPSGGLQKFGFFYYR
ncbi:MAG: hypothetical protein WDN49_16740 [Acetobacteraceae bacterium]